VKHLLAAIVVLATVATVLVAVRQNGEVRRLEHEVWTEMRRRDALDKQIRGREAELATRLSPRSLLEDLDRKIADAAGEDRP
jgi:hypothetical protein